MRSSFAVHISREINGGLLLLQEVGAGIARFFVVRRHGRVARAPENDETAEIEALVNGIHRSDGAAVHGGEWPRQLITGDAFHRDHAHADHARSGRAPFFVSGLRCIDHFVSVSHCSRACVTQLATGETLADLLGKFDMARIAVALLLHRGALHAAHERERFSASSSAQLAARACRQRRRARLRSPAAGRDRRSIREQRGQWGGGAGSWRTFRIFRFGVATEQESSYHGALNGTLIALSCAVDRGHCPASDCRDGCRSRCATRRRERTDCRCRHSAGRAHITIIRTTPLLSRRPTPR